MSETKKSIVINSNFLNPSSSNSNSGTRKKKEKPSFDNKLIKPNAMKKEDLIKKKKDEQVKLKLEKKLLKDKYKCNICDKTFDLEYELIANRLRNS